MAAVGASAAAAPIRQWTRRKMHKPQAEHAAAANDSNANDAPMTGRESHHIVTAMQERFKRWEREHQGISRSLLPRMRGYLINTRIKQRLEDGCSFSLDGSHLRLFSAWFTSERITLAVWSRCHSLRFISIGSSLWLILPAPSYGLRPLLFSWFFPAGRPFTKFTLPSRR